MAEYLVYGFAQSGNSYKPALYLELVGADWKPRFVDYFNGETRTPEYRKINVMGEVPVLEHGKLRLTQSGVILDYLVERFGRYGWNDNAERRSGTTISSPATPPPTATCASWRRTRTRRSWRNSASAPRLPGKCWTPI